MNITELEYVNVSERAAELGCSFPEIAIMPDNFAAARSHKELRMLSHATGLLSVFESANFPLGSFCPAAEHARLREEDYAHWEATLFFSAAVLKREPYAVAVALGIIRDHLAEYFQGQPDRLARLALVIERKSDRACRKLLYEGEVTGFRTLPERVSKIADE